MSRLTRALGFGNGDSRSRPSADSPKVRRIRETMRWRGYDLSEYTDDQIATVSARFPNDISEDGETTEDGRRALAAALEQGDFAPAPEPPPPPPPREDPISRREPPPSPLDDLPNLGDRDRDRERDPLGRPTQRPQRPGQQRSDSAWDFFMGLPWWSKLLAIFIAIQVVLFIVSAVAGGGGGG